ncbi:hypothetical protein J6590_062025 [Homalodisca vitripennis]|nr:hypothetical protein J6590_062025 [Homalodisca vitripennis]
MNRAGQFTKSEDSPYNVTRYGCIGFSHELIADCSASVIWKPICLAGVVLAGNSRIQQ